MNRSTLGFLLLTEVLLLAACFASAPISVTPRPFLDWANPDAPRVTLFEVGQIPTVVVHIPANIERPEGTRIYTGGFFTPPPENGTVSIVHSGTGAIVRRKNSRMRLNYRYRFEFPDLPSSSYVAVLTMRGREITRSPVFRVEGSRGAELAQGSRGIVMTRLIDIEEGERPPERDLFGPGEIPSLYVYGFDGELVTMTITNIQDRQILDRRTTYIPEDKVQWWNLDLEEGSYRAALEVGGVQLASKLFSVRR